MVLIKKKNCYIRTEKAAHNAGAKARKGNKYCATLSKEQRKTCQLTHHGTVIKQLYHQGSRHYGVEVCAECNRYIKFVPWPRRKPRSEHFPLPEPLCDNCRKNKRQWGSTWCDTCIWNLIKDDQPRPQTHKTEALTVWRNAHLEPFLMCSWPLLAHFETPKPYAFLKWVISVLGRYIQKRLSSPAKDSLSVWPPTLF